MMSKKTLEDYYILVSDKQRLSSATDILRSCHDDESRSTLKILYKRQEAIFSQLRKFNSEQQLTQGEP